MTQTIITGVDGSVPAQEAAATAARIASAFGATLHVVSVFDTSDRGASQAGFEPSLAADQIAADAAATLQRDVPGLSVVGQGVAGHKPAETLVTLAETLDAALIVVGTRRVKGLDACWAASRARSPPRPTATSTSRTRTTEPPAAPPLRDVITPGTWRHRG
ncbi:universal stress protein [Nocardioides daphniae]|uniref:UspA domain-containing protein n=1 Tax=Nocardioides daphniae TaxID=402297 RepID=A0ABQ1Q5C0_9ACTN|nr:universal stress protein [Nocardioides daphniae]GGD14532.1 hypothetical protein GCM10007231_11900 [Nocardioides daphniae]